MQLLPKGVRPLEQPGVPHGSNPQGGLKTQLWRVRQVILIKVKPHSSQENSFRWEKYSGILTFCSSFSNLMCCNIFVSDPCVQVSVRSSVKFAKSVSVRRPTCKSTRRLTAQPPPTNAQSVTRHLDTSQIWTPTWQHTAMSGKASEFYLAIAEIPEYKPWTLME